MFLARENGENRAEDCGNLRIYQLRKSKLSEPPACRRSFYKTTFLATKNKSYFIKLVNKTIKQILLYSFKYKIGPPVLGRPLSSDAPPKSVPPIKTYAQLPNLNTLLHNFKILYMHHSYSLYRLFRLFFNPLRSNLYLLLYYFLLSSLN